MFVSSRLQRRSMFNPGAGHVVSSEYESVSVSLKNQVVNEAGTITVAAPAGLTAGQTLLVNVNFSKLTDYYFDKFMWDMGDTIKIVMPSPLPTSPENYIANYIRTHPALTSAIVSSLVNNVITYSIIRPGFALNISSDTANLVTKAITQVGNNGEIANVGDGSAIFYNPADNKMTADVKNLFAFTGTLSTNPVPYFMGVRRAYDKIQNLLATVPAIWESRKDNCCEVVRRGTIHVPLEILAPSALPTKDLLGFVARYSPDGTFTRTGGFRIVDNSVAVPAGCTLLPTNRTELIAVAPDRKTAIIRLV